MSHQSPNTSLKAKDLISEGLPLLHAEESVNEATQHFSKLPAFAVLPVLDTSNALVGLFSAADLVRSRQLLDTKEFLELLMMGLEGEYPDIGHSFNLSTYQEAYDQLCIKDMMSPIDTSVSDDADFEQVVIAFRKSNAAYLPVVTEQNHFVGLISGASLLEKVFA